MKMLRHWVEIVTNFLFAQQVVRPEGSCESDRCKHTAEVYGKRTDFEAIPCDDFFDHICGSYYSEGNHATSYVNTVYERNQEIDKKILDFLNAFDGPAQTDPAFLHVFSFQRACTDITTIQSLNFRQMENELNFLGLSLKWPFLEEEKSLDEMFVTKILARLHATSVGVTGFLFKMSVELVDIGSDYRRVIKIEEVSDPILKSFHRYKFLNAGIRYYLVGVIQEFHNYLGMDLTSEETEIFQTRAQLVSEFLVELKKITEMPTDLGIIQKQSMNVKSFQYFIDRELAGGRIQLHWKEFLKSLYGLYGQSVQSIIESKEEMIILYDVERFKKTLQLLRGTDLPVFVSAMWWIAIDTLVYQSAHPFYRYHEIYESFSPMFLPIDRKQKCLNWIRRHFPLFVAHILAKEDDSSSIKNEVEDMVTNIKSSFSNNLRKIGWLSWKNRSLALKKLKNMNFIVGYTDSILKSSIVEKAYGTTRVEYTNFLPVLCELFKKERKKNLLLLVSSNSPIDDSDLNTPEVEVKYNPRSRSLVIPMSILRFPFFNLGLDVLNYGAVGVHIAYGIARAFDYLWTKPSTKSLVQCFQTLYDTLTLREIRRCVDGNLTLFSNMADAIGFKVSMDAYKIRAKKKGYEQTLLVHKNKEDKEIFEFALDGKENNGEFVIEEEKDEQLFIRAFGNTLCEIGTQEYYNKKSESDEKPLNRARVNGVLMNTSIFAKKWNCIGGKWMNLPQKCKIWN